MRSYADRVAANPGLYATQARLALDYPPVRLRRLEVLLAFEDAVYAGYRRESPTATRPACRMAAIVTVQVVVAAMETWVEVGTPASGPPFEECLALGRRQVEEHTRAHAQPGTEAQAWTRESRCHCRWPRI